MPPAREYILGTDDAELRRLGFQHQLWSDLAHRTWKNSGILPGMRVLDVGCGPGFASLDLSALVGPRGRVVAVDESPAFIDHLRAQAEARGITSIEAHVCDVQRLEAFASDAAPFDLAYSRWVMCFVPDPAAVVRGVARLLRPGGVFCVNDYFNYESMTIAPRCDDFSRGIAAVGRSWRDRGGDPDIIARLPRLCAESGMTLNRLEVDQRIARSGDSMWAWPDTFWRNYIPRLVQSGHLSASEGEAFMRSWHRASNDPHAFMLLPPVFEFIARRG